MAYEEYGPGEDPTALEYTYYTGDLSDAEIAAIRDAGLTTDTSYGSSGSFDWSGIFKTAATTIAGAAAAILPAALTRQTQPTQLGYKTASGYALPLTNTGRKPGVVGGGGSYSPGFLGGFGGGGFSLSSPLGIAAIVGGALLLILAVRK